MGAAQRAQRDGSYDIFVIAPWRPKGRHLAKHLVHGLHHGQPLCLFRWCRELRPRILTFCYPTVVLFLCSLLCILSPCCF
jgi:hypothetical protein